nr:MAG TPA: hypothetical protein [Caudoviricetes sp.]DAZ44273.1 MAG TPA: hypothetical protein [Caudoviricetes sp.]
MFLHKPDAWLIVRSDMPEKLQVLRTLQRVSIFLE